jgi:hypothetical protein
MTKSFAEHTKENRRLAVLRLIRDGGGQANESVLHTSLVNLLGFPLTSREDLRDDLDWLKERRLILVDPLPLEGDRILMVGKITQAGFDAAAGRGAPIEGMARPLIAG